MKVPPPAVAGFERVESITALGVTISRRFSVAEHVDKSTGSFCADIVCFAHS